MNWHHVRVLYRTMRDCTGTYVKVQADTPEQAVNLALDKVRKRRGVYRVDMAEWCGLADPPPLR